MHTPISTRKSPVPVDWPADQVPREIGEGAPLQPSDAGFVLLDSSLAPIYANQDAVRILSYPQVPKTARAAAQVIKKRLRSLLRDHLPSRGNPSLVELSSEKRRYVMRAFYLHPYGKNPSQATYGLLIERRHHHMLDLAHVSQQYGLTAREKETMRLLLGGLTSKEIASRMRISPNTVKVFLRLIMMKMGVTTRAGIIGKIVSG